MSQEGGAPQTPWGQRLLCSGPFQAWPYVPPHLLFICSFCNRPVISWASPVGLVVKNPPEMQKPRVGSLGWEDPLEEEIATHSVLLPGESHGQRSLVGYSP